MSKKSRQTILTKRVNPMTIVLITTIILLGITTWMFYMETKFYKETIADRELTITNYKKVIDAIGRSEGIDIPKLKTELKTDFNINENMQYKKYNNEYYYVLHPKNENVNSQEIWNFLGLQLDLDEQKTFKTVSLYKP